MEKLTDISVLIWDVDSTLYKPNDTLHRGIRNAEINVIVSHTGWSYQKAETSFYSIYKSQTHSGTVAAAQLAGIPVPQAAREMENLYPKWKHLSPDKRLADMFSTLSEFSHFILSNGSATGVVKTIRSVGLDPDFFRSIVTSDTTGKNKPEPDGFNYILRNTGLDASVHLMIGDRDDVDIVPAKKLGMKTCKVWSWGGPADVCIESIYSLPQILPMKS